jgi:hypothetical protein
MFIVRGSLKMLTVQTSFLLVHKLLLRSLCWSGFIGISAMGVI